MSDSIEKNISGKMLELINVIVFFEIYGKRGIFYLLGQYCIVILCYYNKATGVSEILTPFVITRSGLS